MIKRYSITEIEEIWKDECKLAHWQETELAVIRARSEMGLVQAEVYEEISASLISSPFNLGRWHELEKELNHDLQAFVQERQEHLASELRRFLHDEITSYDTEESAFAKMLMQSVVVIQRKVDQLITVLANLADAHRFTIMIARTHGQEAELQSFGKRCCTWIAQLQLGQKRLIASKDNLLFSRLSGPIGGYGDIDPVLEQKTLAILGLKPFYGATQIMPREIYLPTAQALAQIVQTVNKIASDIRLMARSGLPLVQEPFGKKQTGSSAMPHKKNTIGTEKLGGMERLALGYLHAIELCINTWEERAIEQSSVERVAWPDLFHVTGHAIETLTKVLSGLQVYGDNMLQEVVNSRGCYAGGGAKNFLKKFGPGVGIDENDAYRIVQLGAQNVIEPNTWSQGVRDEVCDSLRHANVRLYKAIQMTPVAPSTIAVIISRGALRVSPKLGNDQKTVDRWNAALRVLFMIEGMQRDWCVIFEPSHCLRHEGTIFDAVLGR